MCHTALLFVNNKNSNMYHIILLHSTLFTKNKIGLRQDWVIR